MASPFPGMDPYLEQVDEWEGFHTRLIVRMGDLIAPKLRSGRDGYCVKVEAMLFIHEPPAPRRRFGKADDAVTIGRTGGRPPGGGGVVATQPSVRMRRDDAVDIERHRYLEIRTAGDDRVVTVIELLSPSNKQNPEDRAIYLQKREQLLRAGVHVLQIDLLRRGPRLLFAEAATHDYDAMLVRGEARLDADVWLWSLRDGLPALPVPLAAGDADVTLDLQAAFDVTFDAAAYSPYIYRRPPDPPLRQADAVWATELLHAAGVAPE